MKSLRAIAKMGEEELGYVAMNIFDSFMTDQVNYDSGAFDDWFYQSQGIPAYTVEFWDVSTKAGHPQVWNGKPEDPYAAIKRYNAIMKWVKKNAPQYYSDWKEFDHPTFGKVEIGGINFKYTVQNPPENFLLTECEHDTKFNIRFAKALPQLTINSVESEKVAEGVYKITANVGNLGYLPTNLSDEAVNLHTAKDVEVTIDQKVVEGTSTKKIGNLSGYSRTATGAFYGNLTTFVSAPAKKKVTWIIRAEEGTHVKVSVSQEKSGTCSKEITL